MTLGEVIKILLKRKGLSQVQLAAQIGKSKTSVSQIINGIYSPSQETLESISKVVEVPVPVIHFMSLSADDIPEDKKQLYQMMSPMMDKYLSELFNIEI